MHATLSLTKHVVRPMDLVAIETGLGIRRYSFVSCCWGLLADLDIESEKYRGIGEARFTVGALVRIFGELIKQVSILCLHLSFHMLMNLV